MIRFQNDENVDEKKQKSNNYLFYLIIMNEL